MVRLTAPRDPVGHQRTLVACGHAQYKSWTLSRSLNDGLDVARGEYIARMDADDVSLPFRLQTQVEFLDAHPEVGVVGARVQCINEFGEDMEPADPVPLNSGFIRYLLLFANCVNHPTVMARRSVVMACHGYDVDAYPADDYDLWLRVAERTDIANQDEATVRYRQHGGSITTWWNNVDGRLGPEEFAAHRSLERLGGRPIPFAAFTAERGEDPTLRRPSTPHPSSKYSEGPSVECAGRRPLDDTDRQLIQLDVARRCQALASARCATAGRISSCFCEELPRRGG